MRCKRLTKYAFLIVLAAACSRETKTPPSEAPATVTPAPTSTTAAGTPRYEDAVRWFRTTPGFHFVIEEAGVRAEGEMARSTVGAEEVRVTVNGEEWSAKTSAQGVVWKRAGKEVPPPDWGNRLFQRVTVAFDPEKSEGQAELAGPRHYRFTDANSAAVHNVGVNDAGQIETITIGNTVSMTLSRQQ